MPLWISLFTKWICNSVKSPLQQTFFTGLVSFIVRNNQELFIPSIIILSLKSQPFPYELWYRFMNSLSSSKHWTGLVSLQGIHTLLQRYRVYIPHALGSPESCAEETLTPLVPFKWVKKTSSPGGSQESTDCAGCPFFDLYWEIPRSEPLKKKRKTTHRWSSFGSRRKALCCAAVKIYQLGHEEMNPFSCWTEICVALLAFCISAGTRVAADSASGCSPSSCVWSHSPNDQVPLTFPCGFPQNSTALLRTGSSSLKPEAVAGYPPVVHMA